MLIGSEALTVIYIVLASLGLMHASINDIWNGLPFIGALRRFE